MVSDNPEFYKAFYKRTKQYGPILLFVLTLFLSVLPILFALIKREFYPKQPSSLFIASFVFYGLFNIHLAILSVYLNQQRYLKVFSALLWCFHVYWVSFFLIVHACFQ